MKMLVPIVMLLIGAGAGVGAAVFLRPAEVEVENAAIDDQADQETSELEVPEEPVVDTSALAREYVKLSNQFVVPIVREQRVASMVVMTLSIEVATGQAQIIYDKEPKLRDTFLSVLFDHAAIGGFDGQFTTTNNLDIIRRNLRQSARRAIGEDIVFDVLIFEIARQDY